MSTAKLPTRTRPDEGRYRSVRMLAGIVAVAVLAMVGAPFCPASAASWPTPW